MRHDRGETWKVPFELWAQIYVVVLDVNMFILVMVNWVLSDGSSAKQV